MKNPIKISKQAIRIPKPQPKKLRIVRNGKTPSKEELLDIIRPLIPEIPPQVVKNTPKKALIRLIEEYIANKPLTPPTVDFDMKETDAGTEVTINWVVHLIPRAVYWPKLRAFLQMSDTPDTYEWQAGKVVKVKADETGLEYWIDSDAQNLQSVTDVGSTTTNTITAQKFITTGGKSSQFVTWDWTLRSIQQFTYFV